MKRIIGAIIALILIFPCFSARTVRAEENLSDYNSKITRLEQELAECKAEIAAYQDMVDNFLILIDQISNGDINNDGYTNAVDASQLLSYYAYLSTGGTNTLRKYLLEHDMYK